MKLISKFALFLGFVAGWVGVYATYVKGWTWGSAAFAGAVCLLVGNHIGLKYRNDVSADGARGSLVMSRLVISSFFVAGFVGSWYYGFWAFVLNR